jgi:hypothetical protein
MENYPVLKRVAAGLLVMQIMAVAAAAQTPPVKPADVARPAVKTGEPAANVSKPAAAVVLAKVPMRKIAWLGMATTERVAEVAPELPDGVGLIVQQVAPGTPAAQAGLQRMDIIHKLDEQILVNNPQFRVLMRSFKPGDTIQLSLFRQSKPLTVNVQLGETEAPAVDSSGGIFQWALAPARRMDSIPGSAGFSANYADGEHVLALQTNDKGRHLLAKNQQGVVLFDGTINNDEERKKLPEVLQEKLKRLETPPQAP